MLRRIFGGGSSQTKVSPYSVEPSPDHSLTHSLPHSPTPHTPSNTLSLTPSLTHSHTPTHKPKPKLKTVPKIQPTPHSPTHSPTHSHTHSHEDVCASNRVVQLSSEQVISFLTRLDLSFTTTPLARSREEDPRVEARITCTCTREHCVSEGVAREHCVSEGVAREHCVSEDCTELMDVLKVLRYSPLTHTHSESNSERNSDSDSHTHSLTHSTVLSALWTLRAFLDVSINLIRTDAECHTPLSLADQAVSLVDLLLHKVTHYVQSGCVSECECACVVWTLPEIFRSLHSLWSVIELVDVNAKVLWSQSLTRASTLLVACSSGVVRSCEVKSGVRSSAESLTHLVTAVHTLSQCVTVFRDVCGFPVSTSATMRFWPVCHHAMHCITHSLTQGTIRESVAKSLTSNVYRALASAAPSPQELPALIHTLNTAYPASRATHSVAMDEGVSSVVRTTQHKRRLSSAADGWSRVVYVLTGFQYLLHGTVESDSHSPTHSLRQQLTRPAEWLTALGEALLICLSPSAPACLHSLSHTLAQYFFFVVMACHNHIHSHTHTHTQWIFSELSDHLLKHSTTHTKKQGIITRLQHVASTTSLPHLHTKLSGRPPSSQGSSRKLPLPHSSNSATAMATGTARESPVASRVVYSVGDNVEGLCAVQNGTKRWFPGKVTHVTLSPSDEESSEYVKYSVAFNDGDSKDELTSGEVRSVRNRASRRVLSRQSSVKSQASSTDEHTHSRLPEFESTSVTVDSGRVVKPVPDHGGKTPHSHTHSHTHSLTTAPPVTEPLTDRFDPLDSLSVDEEVNMINSTDINDNDDDDDSDSIIFEIPLVLPRTESPLVNVHSSRSLHYHSANNSVTGESTFSGLHFDTHDVDEGANQLAKLRPGIVVPRMSLDNLDQGAALDRCVSNNSLSGALLRENTNVSSSDACSPRTAIDKILSELVDDNSSSTKLDSWRDSIGWNTRRSTERPNVGKASSTNSLLALAQNQLFQSHEVQRLVNQTTADLTADLTAIKRMSLTYEVIAAILSFKTVLDLSMFEKETLFSVKTASKAKSKPDPYEDSNKQKGILMRPELNSGQCKLYMYAVREFLDSGVCDKDVPFLSMSASHVGACYFRLLKLCSRRFFANSCLPGHLQEGDKIGTGAFGSVHRVSCPQSCSSHAGGGHTVEYAVKRMPRERSLQDEGVLFGVLTEVTCLEMMSDHRGVCDIVNYGVHGNQYWMVLELGMCNLQEWAEELTHQEVLLLSTGKQEQLDGGLTELEVGECASAGIDKLLLKLCIFYEMISILNDVHKKNIIHFDIKCSNFMFRKSPQLDDFLGTVLDNLSSGVLFLTDFGEALQLSEDIDLKLKQRSRGTLAIQSPEMLCVSESGSGLAQSMKLGVESTDEKTKVEINTPSAASDCWSMGCALFELMTGSHLFEGQSFTEMFCLLCKEDFVLPDIAACLVAKGVQPTSVPAIPNCCKALADIIALELVQSPLKRPPLTDLMAATADMIKSMLPFRSGPRNSTADGGPDSIKKQESYSPFYHMKDSSSPFRLVTDEAAPLLGSQTGVVGGSSGRGVHTFTNNDQVDFLDGVKTTSQAPPLAKDCSRDLSAASISSVHCSTVASAQGVLGYSAETVHLSPGTWQFSSSVSLVVSESFAVPFPDATTPIGLDDLYGNMDIKINSIIKNQPVDDDLDASELQSRAVALKDFNMKRSLLLCLRRQFESMSLEATSSCPSPLQSPHDIAKCFKEPKVCHINISMAGADTTPALSVKSAGGIAATSTELPAGPTAKRGTDTVFETSNVSVYRCEVASDPDHAADVLKNAFKFAKLKHGEGFRVQFCVEASAHAGISMSSILSAEHEGSKDKIEVSQSALAAASLLGTLLRHQPVRTTSICTSSDDHSCNDRGAADLYLEKHFPWILTLVDRRMLRTLQVELEEML